MHVALLEGGAPSQARIHLGASVAVLVAMENARLLVDGSAPGRRYRGVLDSGRVGILPSHTRLALESQAPGRVLMISLDADFIDARLERPVHLRGMPSAVDPVLSRIGLEVMSAVGNAAFGMGVPLGSFAEELREHLCTHYARRTRQQVAQPLSAERVARATDFIARHFAEKNLSVADIAGSTGLSAFHFTRMFGAAVGMAPHAFLTEVRLGHARQLLGDTCLPIAEIAQRCGYATHAHFTGVFGRHVGLTPAQYRSQVRDDRAATSLAQRFPHLAPSQILEVIKTAGPLRRDVESALERISAELSPRDG